MADIYQQIWDADQGYAGLKAIKHGSVPDGVLTAGGYVVVNESGSGSDHRLIEEISIPAAKLPTYTSAKKLFNNYTLDQTKRENDFPEEAAEVQDFLEKVYRSPPMDVAREYVASRSGNAVSPDQWWGIVERVWFERYDMGRNKDLSGFEHVVVGEQERGKVKGYHWWYKYYLDERFRRDDGSQEIDSITFLSWEGLPADTSPEIATLSFKWRAFDYEAEAFRPLTKPIGGFWIGPSIAGLLAMGTVAFLPEAAAPRRTVINGVKYDLAVHGSSNGRHLRTFYPVFKEMA